MGNCFGSGKRGAASVEEPLLKGETKVGLSLRLEDDYKILSGALGYGRMATVRVGQEKRTGRKVAIKACSKKMLSLRPPRISQVSEIEALQKIWEGLPVSSQVVELYATYEDTSHLHIVMELCTGGDLFQRLARCDHFAESDAANICRQLLLAVQHCHRHFVVHRDLKPENILVASEQGLDIKLVDFGSAAILTEDEDVLHDFMATPFYAAPEVWSQHYGKECDVWSIGALLYVLVTGLPPSLNSKLVQSYPAWVALQKGVVTGLPDSTSPALMDLLRQLLNPEPSERITLEDALAHPWIVGLAPRSQVNLEGSLRNIRAFARARQFQKAAVALLLVSLSERKAQELISRIRHEASQHSSSSNVSSRMTKSQISDGQSATTNVRVGVPAGSEPDIVSDGQVAQGELAEDVEEWEKDIRVGAERLESELRQMGQGAVSERLAAIRAQIYGAEEEGDHPEILLEDFVSILRCRDVVLPHSRGWGKSALHRAFRDTHDSISGLFSPSKGTPDPNGVGSRQRPLPPFPARIPSVKAGGMGPKGWSSPNLSSLDKPATADKGSSRLAGWGSPSPSQILEDVAVEDDHPTGLTSPIPDFDTPALHSTVHGEFLYQHMVQLQKASMERKQ